MELKVTRIREVKSPRRANQGDAGIDFFIPADFPETILHHGESVLIPAGVRVDVPEGWSLVFFNKSGVSSKKHLLVGACVIDHGYAGEVHINLHNAGKESCKLSPGEKIVQGLMLLIGSHQPVESSPAEMWKEVNDEVSTRGASGFGSTGD